MRACWAGPASLWPVAGREKVPGLPISEHLLAQLFWVEARGLLVATHSDVTHSSNTRAVQSGTKASLSVTLVDALPHGNRKKRKSWLAPTFPKVFLFQPVGLSTKASIKMGITLPRWMRQQEMEVSCFQTLESIHPIPSAVSYGSGWPGLLCPQTVWNMSEQ